MAYGAVMKKNIPENSDLMFDVELLGCNKEDDIKDVDVAQLQEAAAMATAEEETEKEAADLAEGGAAEWKRDKLKSLIIFKILKINVKY